MTPLTESFKHLKHTPLYATNKIREIIQWRLLPWMPLSAVTAGLKCWCKGNLKLKLVLFLPRLFYHLCQQRTVENAGRNTLEKTRQSIRWSCLEGKRKSRLISTRCNPPQLYTRVGTTRTLREQIFRSRHSEINLNLGYGC